MKDVTEVVQPGQTVKARIHNLDMASGRVGLTMRSAESQQEQEERATERSERSQAPMQARAARRAPRGRSSGQLVLWSQRRLRLSGFLTACAGAFWESDFCLVRLCCWSFVCAVHADISLPFSCCSTFKSAMCLQRRGTSSTRRWVRRSRAPWTP